MNKKSILFKICILIITIIFMVPCYSNAYMGAVETEEGIDYRNNTIESENRYVLEGYLLEDYNVDILVNEDNSFDITETIKAKFYKEKHGIFRKLPLQNKVIRNNGSISMNRATISNISVDEQFSLSTENGYKVIKIGNPDKTITGEHTYKIKYTYAIGKDPLKNEDELYFNIIGTQWDTYIDKVNFKITMPKEFDKSLLGMTSGMEGSQDTSNVEFEVNGNVITGSIINPLSPNEGLTVRLSLPEGYFLTPKIQPDKYSLCLIFGCIISVIVAFLLWYKYGKDDPVIETVEFYPPDGLNSAELQFIYDGKINNKGIISLLIYLADKGYLKIEETTVDLFLFKDKGFRITKLKDYTGNNEFERLFFYGLFRNATSTKVDVAKAREIVEEARKRHEVIRYKDALKMTEEFEEGKKYVTNADLYDKFYRTIEEIKAEFNSKENKNKIFEKSSRKGKWVGLIAAILYVLMTYKPVMEYSTDGFSSLILALVFPGIGFSVILAALFEKGTFTKVFAFLWGVLFGLLPWMQTVLPVIGINKIYLITYIFGIISVLILTFFAEIMIKRTPYGIEMLGKIRGFKRFLETAEKEQLEFLVHQNPEYFYNILPYTYALGISDKWMKQFESIAMQAPSWYDSPSAFSMSSFSTFMSETMRTANSTMTYDSTSSSSGGSSGGGSSGGGSGGGGGGSW